MKVLKDDELNTPVDMVVTTPPGTLIRVGGKAYKSGETIKAVSGQDKALLLAQKRAEIVEPKGNK